MYTCSELLSEALAAVNVLWVDGEPLTLFSLLRAAGGAGAASGSDG